MDQVRVQLSRWVRAGKLVRIHKGWYALAAPWRRMPVNPFVIACSIKPGSYVSMQSALSFHGMIPEYVPETTCITTGRPQIIQTPFGRISYRHLKRNAFRGFYTEAFDGQTAFMASAEKALLDLIYLTPGGADRNYIDGLRLQNMQDLNPGKLSEMAACFAQSNLASVPALLREPEFQKRMETR